MPTRSPAQMSKQGSRQILDHNQLLENRQVHGLASEGF